MAFYSCPYTYIDGRACRKKCYQQEGCHIHWKRQSRIPCGECGIPTASSYGMCMKHAVIIKTNFHLRATYSLPDNSLYVPNGADMGEKLLDYSGYFGRGYLGIH